MTELPGLTVVHRRYVDAGHAHYAGGLVDGAFVLALFGDVATEVCIRTDGDEGLFASYSDVQFRAPVRAGDHVLVHAAAGGVGLILCQWAKHLGCTVIGTVGSGR